VDWPTDLPQVIPYGNHCPRGLAAHAEMETGKPNRERILRPSEKLRVSTPAYSDTLFEDFEEGPSNRSTYRTSNYKHSHWRLLVEADDVFAHLLSRPTTGVAAQGLRELGRRGRWEKLLRNCCGEPSEANLARPNLRPNANGCLLPG